MLMWENLSVFVHEHPLLAAVLAVDVVLVVGLIAVSLSIAGAALFVRYSIAQFLRFWIARLTYEQQAQTDRVVDAIKQKSE